MSYNADGKARHGRLDTYSSGYEVGKRIPIYCDPSDPDRIHGVSRKLGMILWLAGPAVAILSAVSLVRDSRKENGRP